MAQRTDFIEGGRVRSLIDGSLSEKSFQRQVEKLASALGWWGYHTDNSRRSAPGFPDLTLVKPPRIIVVEVKAQRGKFTPHQADVLDMFSKCPALKAIYGVRQVGLKLSGCRASRTSQRGR